MKCFQCRPINPPPSVVPTLLIRSVRNSQESIMDLTERISYAGDAESGREIERVDVS